jgi:hypothetical protein
MKLNLSRRARWILLIVLTLIVIVVASFIQKRAKDKTAWPTALITGDCVGATPAGLSLITHKESKELLASNKAQSPQLTQAYRHYLIHGYDQSFVVPYSSSRALELAPVHNKLTALLDEKPGFDATEYGSVPFNEVSLLLMEYQLLKNIQAAGQLETRQAEDYQHQAMQLWLKPLHYMHTALRGSGVFGRGLAAEIARTFSAEVLMGAEKHAFTYEQVKEFNAEVRKYLQAPDSLEQAIRDDFKAFSGAAQAMYEQMAGAPANEVYGGKRIGGVTGIYVKLLGGSPETTQKNLESVFSYLIVNSRKPYTPASILEGLPLWCHGQESGPYTVDPIGEAIVSAYLGQARTVAAIVCHYETELRITMLGFAINAYKHSKGAYPASLNVLVEEGLIQESDLVDPFSLNRAGKLQYLTQNNGAEWRIYSVGVDQKDNGGVLPINRADSKNQTELERSDLVYQSGERERRIKVASSPR